MPGKRGRRLRPPPDVKAEGLLKEDVPVVGTRYGTRKLPAICGAPLQHRKKKNGVIEYIQPPEDEQVPLMPTDLRAMGYDRYANVCTRGSGWRTSHEGTGYCLPCEKIWQKTVGKDRQGGEIKRFHDEVRRRYDFLGEPMDITPHEALMQEVQRTAALVAWLEDKLRQQEEGAEDPDDFLGQWTKMGMIPSNLWAVFQWEREHLVKSSQIAIKAGVAERKVQLAEQQGRLIAAFVQAFIVNERMGLTPQQRAVAPQVVAQIFQTFRGNNQAVGTLELSSGN